MLDILKNKLLAWTPESANKFHNNIPRYHPLGNQVWEMTPSGYFLIDASKTEYRDYNGSRYVLEYGDQTATLQLKQELSALAKTKTMFPIENVTVIQLTDIYGLPYTYSKHENPVPTRGIPLENAKDVTENESDVFKSLIKILLKESENFILTLDELTKDTESLQYPVTLNLPLLNYDPVTSTYFWSGDFALKIPRATAITELVNFVNNYNSVFTMVYKKSTESQADLQNFINTECTIYQNP
jgi:hypothetical protein